MPAVLQCGRYRLDLSRPQVMGVINLTPDSFSDGGQFATLSDAIDHAVRLIEEGADLLDLGAESTRPGAQSLSADNELARLVPVLRQVRQLGRPISIDTRKPEVMRAALAEGADMINDVSGFVLPEAIDAVAGVQCAVCVMHMQGEPSTMQQAPTYRSVVSEVRAFLQDRMQTLLAAGLDVERIVLDPGIGFGKTLDHNLMLLHQLSSLNSLGAPVLVGLSRKSMIGQLTGQPVERRLAGSIAGALASVERGASIVRVHDVRATVDALRVWRAVQMRPEERSS
jgi:dihydropteroate synthase